MARSCQPTYVADRDSRLHIEDRLVDGRVSITRCGLELDTRNGDVPARVFHLSYRHLFVDGCRGCAEATHV